jgi:transposase
MGRFYHISPCASISPSVFTGIPSHPSHLRNTRSSGRLENEFSYTIKEVREGAHAFAQLLRERQAGGLPVWLENAEQSAASEMRSFATGLRQDVAAVTAAMQYEWSNGQVEGQINKLKLLKRQMYGRAKLDLLKARFLTAR